MYRTPAPTLFRDAQTQVSGRKSEKYIAQAKKIAITVKGDHLKDEEIRRLKEQLETEKKKTQHQKEITGLFLRQLTVAEEEITRLQNREITQNLQVHALRKYSLCATRSKPKTNEVLGQRPMWRR